MKKFFLYATAVYLFLLALLSLVTCLVSFIGLINQYSTQDINPLVFLLYGSLFVGWLTSTGIGIILRKTWSRYSILIMSIIATMIGLILSIILSFVGIFYSTSSIVNKMIGLLITLIPIVLLLIVLPIIYLIFFTRKSVIELFHDGNAEKNFVRPVGITILAIINIISAVTMVLWIIYPMNHVVLVFGFLISGLTLKIYELLLSLIAFYISYGFWKLQKSAWVVSIISLCFLTIEGLVNFLSINNGKLAERLIISLENVYNQNPLKVIYFIDTIVYIVILVYIILQKKSFLNKQLYISNNSEKVNQ